MDNSIIELSRYKPSGVLVYNDECIPPILHLSIPEDLIDFSVIGITNLDDVSECIPYYILNKSGKWIDVEFKHLSKFPGYHRYKISGFVGSETVLLYFSYRVQSDNPDKPYIYMKRGVN